MHLRQANYIVRLCLLLPNMYFPVMYEVNVITRLLFLQISLLSTPFIALLISLPTMSTASSTESVYDYIIVGGGTAGLVLANRLSEDEDITVAVIEAGGDAGSDPRSFIPALWTNTFGTELDWNFPTVPQV